MPKVLEDCVKRVMTQGRSKSSAFAICTASLQKSGSLKKGTQELTDRGRKRNAMSKAVEKRK